jgi:hypothetical protein
VPVFFAVLYYTKSETVRDLYNYHNFVTVPYIAASRMQIKRDNVGYEDFYKEEHIWLLKKDDVFDTHFQLEFVNKQLSTSVQLSLPFHTVLLRNLTMFLVLGLLIALVASI